MAKTSARQSTSCNAPLRRSIEDFVDVQYNSVLAGSACSSCGASMVHVETTLYPLGGAHAWNIPLPVCPNVTSTEAVS
jgi:hypothetical protein